jgi:hypothetical protein
VVSEQRARASVVIAPHPCTDQTGNYRDVQVAVGPRSFATRGNQPGGTLGRWWTPLQRSSLEASIRIVHDSKRRLIPVGLLALGGSLLAVSPVSAESSVAVSAAPSGTSSAYGIIDTLDAGGSSSLVVVGGDLSPGTADDSVYVVDDSLLRTFPPLATSASIPTTLSMGSRITALTVADLTFYAGINGSGTRQLLAYPIGAQDPAVPSAVANLSVEASSIAVGGRGTFDTDDDTVYMVAYNGQNGISQFTPALDDSATTEFATANVQPGTVVVSGSRTFGSSDDTVYVRGNTYGSGALIAMTPALDDSVWRDPLGYGGSDLSLWDDSLVVGSYNGMRIVNGADFDDSVGIELAGMESAVNAVGVIATVTYGGGYVPRNIGIVDGSDLSVLDVLDMGYSTSGSASVAAAYDGTFYAAGSTSVVSIIDQVNAGAMAPASGDSGTTVTLPFTTASARLVDDSAVAAVWWGDDTVPFTRLVGQNAIEVNTPNVSGAVEVVIELRGGDGLSLGSFVPTSAPQPATPAGPPLDLSATGVDRAIDVTWAAPDAAGSFPVTYYQGQVEGSSRQCLVPATTEREPTCRIEPLTNGAEYRLRVRALTGAGWGAWSDSVTVVPLRGTIVITGSRDGGSVVVNGVTTGLVGEQVTPWVRFPGPHRYEPGSGVRTVGEDGTFTWQRRTGKKAYVYFRSGDDIRSNRVIISARAR